MGIKNNVNCSNKREPIIFSAAASTSVKANGASRTKIMTKGSASFIRASALVKLVAYTLQRRSCLIAIGLTVPYLLARNFSSLYPFPIHDKTAYPIANPKCAIIMYGTPRSFSSIVLPTLKENIIRPNVKSQCDYFVHVHQQEFDEAPSYIGRSGHVNANDTYQLEKAVRDISSLFSDAYTPTVKFVSSTNDECFNRRKDLLLKTHTLKDRAGHWIYFPEIIRSWDGLELAWNLMETTQQQNNVTYDHVAVIRSDVAYIEPIDINERLMGFTTQSLTILGSPPSNLKGGTSQELVDGTKYIAYGSYDAVRIWATERFSKLDKYLNKLKYKRESSRMSEHSFITDVLVPSMKWRWITVDIEPNGSVLDVLPDESVSLAGIIDPLSTKLLLEKIVGIPCVPAYEADSGSKLESCSWRNDKLKSLADSTKKDSDKAAICLIVSNEEYYLDEWLDYHLGIGFSHVFIYDNSGDLNKGWLSRRPRLHSKVTVHPYPGQDKQGLAYQHCGQNYLFGHYRWVGFFDVDEYLVLKKHENVKSFLLEYCKEGAISLSWQLHSWGGRVQFSPDPVTKRFQGMHSVDQHVKTISSVDAVNWTVTHHPHYAFLKNGFRQVDTNGIDISPNWQNLRTPSDVAVFFHHHCKSHKEYIAKRSRGRATMSGAALIQSRNELVEKAKNKVGFHNTTRIDLLAWDKLKSVSPKYLLFDSPDLHFTVRSRTAPNVSNAICTVVSDDEAYIDEWADYHLAMGFSAIYLFDSNEENWMRQWGDERSQSAPVEVIHFPGNDTDPSFRAKAFSKCIELHRQSHDAMAFLDVNDFIILPDSDGLEALDTQLQSSAKCAYPIERIFFGNAGQAVYDPLPVTKRFMFRVEGNIPSQSVILVKTKDGSISSLDKFQSAVSKFLDSYKWKSRLCPGSTVPPNKIVVYHYLRSEKECNKQKGNKELCSLEGTAEDRFAWEKLQALLPGYSKFNGFL